MISFNNGNTGSNPLLYDPVDPNINMTIVLTLSDGVPDNADSLAALGGTWVNKFSWSYNPAVKTYIANQIADILGDRQGPITVQYKVINNTPLTTSSNGINVNLQPTPYSNGSNNTGDDAVSCYTFTRAYDFGEAPVSYGEARHEINVFRDPDQEFQYTKYIVLGSTVDPENVKDIGATANGDDLNGSDDENGLVIPALTQGTTVTLGVTVTAHELSTGYLNAWFDWNGDGDFLDVGERVTPTAIAATQTGVYNITLNVPLNAITTAPTFARFRVGPANNAFADASYRDNTYGEAEDYMITIVPKSLSIGDYVWDDLDGDGIQDSGETGLSGVIVELYDCNSNGSPLSRATTDATGLFLFENVLTGSYYIKFILPGTNKFRCNGQK